jgi:hypothetical protein
VQQVLVQQEVVQLPQPEVLASAAEAPVRAVWAGRASEAK